MFFVFHVIIASILLSRPVSYLMAGLASLLFAAVALSECAGLIPHYHLPIFAVELYQEPLYLLFAMTTVTLTLFLVTHLATSITMQLRARDRELLESNLICQIRSTELEQLNERLQQIDQERTRFIVLVTHELRAPINTVYSALEVALSGVASPEKTNEILARAQRRVSELLDLIRDLLDLAKAREQARQQPEVVPIQLADELHDVADFVRVEAEEKDLKLELALADDLAPVRIPQDQARVVWTNLLSNAVKYTRAKGSVYVSLRQDQQQIIGVVRDTGIGIAPDDLSHVFDEFFRAGNARTVSPHGTGVGMAVVQRIIENWGGKIWVQSELGVGSTFTFALPAAVTEGHPAARGPSRSGPPQ
jgi:signal transduction histidine kinase